jgi:AraC family transcriptional regulator
MAGNFMLSSLLTHGHDVQALPSATANSPLSCLAVAAGYEQRRNEVYSWDGMNRGSSPFLVIQHTLMGEGRLDYAGTRHVLRPGQTMLVTMPHEHRYYLERGGNWEYFWFLLAGREALRLARAILDLSGPVLHLPEPLVDRLARHCQSLLSKPALNPGQSSAQAYAAMAVLHDAAFGDDRPSTVPLPPAIARVVHHIEGNLGSNLSVESLAGIAEISRAHFVRRFTQALGCAPSDHVLHRRLDRVERLLLATEMSVGEIARLTGFADGNYLAKAFRRKRGMAPLQFRATRAEAV